MPPPRVSSSALRPAAVGPVDPRSEAEIRSTIVARAKEQLGVSEQGNPARIAYFTKGRGGEWCTEFCSYVLAAARAVPRALRTIEGR